MQQKRVTPEEAKALLEAGEGYTYLDVRTAEEFVAGHVPGAVNIPVLVRRPGGGGMEPNPRFLEDVKSKFAPEARLITGCLRGGRSLRAAEVLAAGGARVDVYDAMPSVGRKFLLAGKGGMNITHAEPIDAFVGRYGARAGDVKAWLDAFPPEQVDLYLNALWLQDSERWAVLEKSADWP